MSRNRPWEDWKENQPSLGGRASITHVEGEHNKKKKKKR